MRSNGSDGTSHAHSQKTIVHSKATNEILIKCEMLFRGIRRCYAMRILIKYRYNGKDNPN